MVSDSETWGSFVTFGEVISKASILISGGWMGVETVWGHIDIVLDGKYCFVWLDGVARQNNIEHSDNLIQTPDSHRVLGKPPKRTNEKSS